MDDSEAEYFSDPDDDISPEEKLLQAARNGKQEVIEDLLQKIKDGAISLDINCKGNQKSNRGWSALHLAAYFGHTDTVLCLLKNGADVNIMNSHGDTPLHKAALTSRVDTVRVLLDHNADVSMVNAEGQTPKITTKSKDVTDIIKAAEKHDTRQREEEFLSSVREGDVDGVQDMLKASNKRPNVSCKDSYGNTALHIAAQANQREVAVLLIQSGLSANIKNSKEQTALDFARSSEMKQILGVRPVKEFTLHPQRSEGNLLKKSRFVGFKPVWIVLERGVLSVFRNRGDASTGSRRKGMKYLDKAKILVPNVPGVLVMNYSDGITHTFCTEQNDGNVSRQKWINSIKDHITYSTHYTHQMAPRSDDDEEVLPVTSLQEALKTSQAHQKLLEEQIAELNNTVNGLEPEKRISQKVLLQSVNDNVQKMVKKSQEMTTSLNHCLTLFCQQDEVRALQLKEEMEKSRVLQEALHALATEHHELERSISNSKSPPRCYDTDEDEFYDCDDDDDEESVDNNEDDQEDVYKESVAETMSFESTNTEFLPDLQNGAVTKYGRSKLPVPMFDRNDFSIWSILKQCIGKELSKITMPVVFNEPLNFIQRISEYMEYADLLEKAATCQSPVDRMKYVAAYAVSAISSNWERIGKPFNPLLGETFELNRTELGFKLVGEQVSHHPPVSAIHVDSPQYKFTGSVQPKLRFWGKSVEVNPKGVMTLEIPKYGDVYTWSNINCCVHNVIVGKLWVEHYGVMEITNHKTKHKAIINFKQGGWFAKDLHKVEGYIYDQNKQKLKALYGSWILDLYAVDAEVYDQFTKDLNTGHSPSHNAKTNGASNSSDAGNSIPVKTLSSYDLHIPGQETLWQAHPRPEYCHQYFNFTLFAMALNEIMEDTGSLPPTDARFRPDIRLLEQGQIELAAAEKNRLEEKQRAARKDRRRKREEWTPVWFKQDTNPYTGKEDWLFKGDYWKRNWSSCPDIF